MGGICETDCAAVDAGRPKAIGLAIASARRYDRAVRLSSLELRSPVPQSFAYVGKRTVERISACGQASRTQSGVNSPSLSECSRICMDHVSPLFARVANHR
jgi:hypothetical protein